MCFIRLHCTGMCRYGTCNEFWNNFIVTNFPGDSTVSYSSFASDCEHVDKIRVVLVILKGNVY